MSHMFLPSCPAQQAAPALSFCTVDKDALVFEVAAPEAVPARAALLTLGLSKPTVARVFAEGRLELAEASSTAQPHTRLALGTRVVMRCARTYELAVGSQPAIDVLYEDPFILAVNKPAGLLVHGDGTGAPTLTDRVAFYLAEQGELFAPQAVQRLDVDTTGVVLFSKTAEFQPLFDALVAGHDMRKRYLAVVAGAFLQKRVIYEDPLARDRHDARRMRVTSSGGQQARTEVERLAVDPAGQRSLLSVVLGTGRKHQIRVHLASHGYPIVGDPLYGSRLDARGLMLHAYEESFVHPVTGKLVALCSGWPERFSTWFDPADVPLRDKESRTHTSGKAARHASSR